MADYTDQDVNGLLPGEPWTSAKAIAAFENPVAIAEGAGGAPYVSQAWHPYGGVTNGDVEGVLYDYAIDGAISTFDFTVTPGFEYVARLDGLWSAGDTQRNMQVEYNIGGTWRLFRTYIMANSPVGVGSQNFKHWGHLQMDKVGSIRPIYGGEFSGGASLISESSLSGDPGELMTIENGDGVLQLAPSARGLPSAVRFRLTAGTYAGGKVFLSRQRFWGGV